MLLKFAVKDFLDDREFKNLSTATLSGYKLTLNEFHAYCVTNDAIDVTDVTPATLKGYLLYCRRERGNGPTSLNHKLGNLRIFFSYLEEIEAIDKRGNPARKVMPVKADVKIEVFTDGRHMPPTTLLSCLCNHCCLSVVQHMRRQQPNCTVPVFGIIPAKKSLTMCACILS